MRGTLRGIEVERWGGEQAHRMVGSLKPLQDLHASAKELSRPASALAFFFSTVLPPNKCSHKVWMSSFYDLFVGIVGGT